MLKFFNLFNFTYIVIHLVKNLFSCKKMQVFWQGDERIRVSEMIFLRHAAGVSSLDKEN